MRVREEVWREIFSSLNYSGARAHAVDGGEVEGATDWEGTDGQRLDENDAMSED
jgi:hypothetical protein